MSSERDIDPVLLAALDDPLVRPVLLVRLDLDGLTVAWNSGFGDISYDGVVYEPTGLLGEVSDLSENVQMSPTSMTLKVSGLDPSIRSLVMSNTMINRPAIVYLGALDEAGALIGNPMVWFDGTLRGGSKIELGNSATIEITITDSLADWERPLSHRMNNATQQELYPGDRGLEFMESISRQTLNWPGAHFWKHQ